MFSITPSHIIQHLYCPRFTYFEWVLRLPQNEEKYSKVLRGRGIHDERLERNKGYLRKRLEWLLGTMTSISRITFLGAE